ncbi:LAMI_0H06436g1_1 [Lachancea mirantina]|uniref:Histone H1 n=1 Tax=Lachancea mirantina TaxID=1230905 RepID=A0A1G4KFG4_9SACH|nr:LAMI_0H06436g1_1 [Lachancea mirantina]
MPTRTRAKPPTDNAVAILKKKTAARAKEKKELAQHVKETSKESELPTYKDMIIEGITSLSEKNGSSRQALKKYISTKYSMRDGFEARLNLAIRRGIETGAFTQPKGPSGPIKVNKSNKVEKPLTEKTAGTKTSTKLKQESKPAEDFKKPKSKGKVVKTVEAKPVAKEAKQTKALRDKKEMPSASTRGKTLSAKESKDRVTPSATRGAGRLRSSNVPRAQKLKT